MKKLLSILTLFIFFQPSTGNAQSQDPKSQAIITSNSNLKIKESGFEIYVCVLRYKDSVILDISPLPRKSQYASVNNYRHLDYDFSNPIMMKIPQDKISKDDLLILISNFKFDFSNGFLYKEFYLHTDQKNASKDYNFHLIDQKAVKAVYPSFLTFRVEKIYIGN